MRRFAYVNPTEVRGVKSDVEDFVTCGEMTRRLDVTGKTLRSWARRGLIAPPRFTPGGRLRFSRRLFPFGRTAL